MWIFTNTAFLSIVSHKTDPDHLLVRARHAGDIESIFPAAQVMVTPTADYRYQACVLRAIVAKEIVDQLSAIDYANLKDSVTDRSRRGAYLNVWREMFMWQEAQLEPSPAPRKTAPKATRRPVARLLKRRR
jgi:hypothetical protein